MLGRFTTTVILAIGLVLMTAPAVTAGTTEHDSVIPTTLTTPATSEGHRYNLQLEAGESLDISVTWQKPDADIDVRVSGPASVCQVLPSPAVFCLAAGATARAEGAACQRGNAGSDLGFGPGEETVSTTADQTGEYSIYVVVSTAPPTSTVPYHLSVTTGLDGDDSLKGPDSTGLIRSSGHCRTP